MSTATAPNTRMALYLAFVLYPVWVLATYLLEGRIHTLLRPEAMGAPLLRPRHQHPDRDRRIGSCDPLAVEGGAISTEQAGFRGFGHAAIAVVIDVVLGLAFYALQGAPSWNPIILINAYAQVLVTSTAEVLVC